MVAVEPQDLSKLPSVSALLTSPPLAHFPHSIAVVAARRAIAEARSAPGSSPADGIAERAAELAANMSRSAFGGAINCSGTILNTGLGRAKLADVALDAMLQAAGHSVLEFDVESGTRGDRQAPLAPLLTQLTGAEDALVVNNNAGAVMLALNTLASGKEVLLSRGQSVEIGGAFRLPDVVGASGAHLVDVGCTNKTRTSDYETACSSDTAAILRCHPSNFVVSGFVEEPTVAEMVALARKADVALIDDVGSGCLVRTDEFGLPRERTIQDAIADGADVVTASGDKLLGGPQAGIILGKGEAIAAMKKNPMARALRIDKVAAAALEATLQLYVQGRAAEIPTIRYLSRSAEEVRSLCESLAQQLNAAGASCVVEASKSEPGGGSLPGVTIDSFRVCFTDGNAEAHAKRFRTNSIPVVGYIEKGKYCLDLRTCDEVELAEIITAATS